MLLLIVLLIILWVSQFILARQQYRHFHRTITNMKRIHGEKNLGVGVKRKKVGKGSVFIIATDLTGNIVEAKEMTGVSIFTRFKPTGELVGCHIDDYFNLNGVRQEALHDALQEIKNVMGKIE